MNRVSPASEGERAMMRTALSVVISPTIQYLPDRPRRVGASLISETVTLSGVALVAMTTSSMVSPSMSPSRRKALSWYWLVRIHPVAARATTIQAAASQISRRVRLRPGRPI